MDKMNWVDEQEKKLAENSNFFDIVEGDNRFQLLTYTAPFPLKWTGTTYEPAEEGDTDISIKGVCWVLQDGKIKLAKLPYTAVKQIKALMEDPDYAFDEFPMPRAVNLKAKNAKTKEVEYSLIPSPKETPISTEILEELAKKPTPEEVVEKEKGKKVEAPENVAATPEVHPEDIPF